MSETKRLFFGVGLDQGMTEHLETWLTHSVIAKKPHTKPSNWHLTLAFLPSVSAEQQVQLIEFACALKVTRFSLTFSETGYWAHNGIFYLKPDFIAPQLKALAEPLRNKGTELGIYDNPYGFSPHITLYRSHKPSPELNQAIAPCSLKVNQFHLYHSHRTEADGLIYEPIETFNLI